MTAEMKKVEPDIRLTNVNLEKINHIADRMKKSPGEVVNAMIYIITSDTSGIKEDLELFCDNNITMRERLAADILLQYKARYLQKIENFTELKCMMESLNNA